MVPVFLAGALSRRIGADLGFGAAGTGAALSVFFVVGGVTAVPVGWLAERLGPPASMRVGVTLSGIAGLAVATVVGSWLQLAVALGVAGLAIGFVDTAASGWFATAVPPGRHGSAFGLKEASVPTASLLAGLAVPLLAARVGWRPTFGLGAALVLLVWLVVPRSAPRAPDEPPPAPSASRWGPLVVFAAAVALGTGAATAAATFLVPALEETGWSSSAAGVVLAVASVASIAARLVLGRATDDRPGLEWWLTGAAMGVGSLGAAGLAGGLEGAAVVGAAVVLLGAGWAWTGMAFHAVLVATLHAPALGAGLVLSGLSLGGAVGPAAFGAVSASASYGWAWALSCAALATASALTGVAGVWQRRGGRGAPSHQGT